MSRNQKEKDQAYAEGKAWSEGFMNGMERNQGVLAYAWHRSNKGLAPFSLGEEVQYLLGLQKAYAQIVEQLEARLKDKGAQCSCQSWEVCPKCFADKTGG